MSNQFPRRVLLATISLAIVMLVATTHAQPYPDVRIEGAEFADGLVTVTGRNFGEAAPTVTLDDYTLLVTENTSERIVAQLPVLEPGIYLLRVTRDGGETPQTRSERFVKIE